MDTVLYKQLLAIVATIEKLQSQFENSTVSVTNTLKNLKEKNEISKKSLDNNSLL